MVKFNLRFSNNLKLGRAVLTVRGLRKKFVYIFCLPKQAVKPSLGYNKTHAFLTRFKFTASILDRLVKNGLIS
jgi:hypothetical protein